MKKREKQVLQKQDETALRFSLRFDKVHSPKSFQLQLINSAEERIVIPRPQKFCIFKQKNHGVVKSSNVSQHHIEDELKLQNLQFKKPLKVNVKAYYHSRTRSHPCPQYQEEAQDEILSDFSNSLLNISSQIIEIPFANRTITHKAHTAAKQPNRNTPLLSRNTATSLKRSLDKPKTGSEDKKRHGKKISRSKQNTKAPRKNQIGKLQANLVTKPKKAVNLCVKLGLSDFSLKAIKITKSGSIIYMAVHRKSGAIYALKSTRKSKAKQRLSQFILELKLGFYANHPNITKIYGFFQQSDNIYIIKELLQEGALVDKRVQEGLVPQYINQVIYGVLGLVNLIKGSNWHVTPFNLAKSNGIIKITNVFSSDRHARQSFFEEFKKTIEYFLETGRRSTFQELTKQSFRYSDFSANQKLLESFIETVQKMLIIESKEALKLLWQEPFLKQQRFKAIMQI